MSPTLRGRALSAPNSPHSFLDTTPRAKIVYSTAREIAIYLDTPPALCVSFKNTFTPPRSGASCLLTRRGLQLLRPTSLLAPSYTSRRHQPTVVSNLLHHMIDDDALKIVTSDKTNTPHIINSFSSASLMPPIVTTTVLRSIFDYYHLDYYLLDYFVDEFCASFDQHHELVVGFASRPTKNDDFSLVALPPQRKIVNPPNHIPAPHDDCFIINFSSRCAPLFSLPPQKRVLPSAPLTRASPLPLVVHSRVWGQRPIPIPLSSIPAPPNLPTPPKPGQAPPLAARLLNLTKTLPATPTSPIFLPPKAISPRKTRPLSHPARTPTLNSGSRAPLATLAPTQLSPLAPLSPKTRRGTYLHSSRPFSDCFRLLHRRKIPPQGFGGGIRG